MVKFDEAGDVLELYWDPTGISHSTVTSMREHKGYLYIGGLENNRIGRIRLDRADPTWTGYEAYWGDKQPIEASPWPPSPISCGTSISVLFPNAEQHAIPSLDGALSPNEALDHAGRSASRFRALDDIVEGPDGALYVSAGPQRICALGPGFTRRATSSPSSRRT